MSFLDLVTEIQRLFGFHSEMRKLKGVPIAFEDLLHALDDDRATRQGLFSEECSSMAALHVRQVLGIRRYDA